MAAEEPTTEVALVPGTVEKVPLATEIRVRGRVTGKAKSVSLTAMVMVWASGVLFLIVTGVREERESWAGVFPEPADWLEVACRLKIVKSPKVKPAGLPGSPASTVPTAGLASPAN